jgi:hypothetical protein
MAATIFSPSSLLTPSFNTLGALSTNFLLSTKLSPSMDLTSLMIFGLDAASKDWSFSVKSVFSAAGGGASSSSTAAAAGPAAAEDEAAAGAAKEMSGILRRDCVGRRVCQSCCHGIGIGIKACLSRQRKGPTALNHGSSKLHTFRLATKSAVSSKVN